MMGANSLWLHNAKCAQVRDLAGIHGLQPPINDTEYEIHSSLCHLKTYLHLFSNNQTSELQLVQVEFLL